MSEKYSKDDLNHMLQAVNEGTPMSKLLKTIGRGKTFCGLERKLRNLTLSHPETWDKDRVQSYISTEIKRREEKIRRKYPKKRVKLVAQHGECKKAKKEKKQPIRLGYCLGDVTCDDDLIIAEIIPDNAFCPEFVERDFRTHIKRFLEYLGREDLDAYIDLTYQDGRVGIVNLKIDGVMPGKMDFLEKYANFLREESAKSR